MQTQYGNLPIEIDEQTGRARLTRAVKPAETMKVRQALSGAPADYDSKLEAERARYLAGLQIGGEVKAWKYHPFTVKLAEKKSYTPDFLVEWHDGRIVLEEVKGSTKSKNARDSITRLHVAAANLPMFEWALVQRKRRIWEEARV